MTSAKSMYSGKENLELKSSMDTHVKELVQLIRSKYLSTEARSNLMDFARWTERRAPWWHHGGNHRHGSGLDMVPPDPPRLQAAGAIGRERLHPPVTDSMPKRVPDEGDTVVVEGQTYFLPGGTNINYGAWPLHLHKDLFGADADEFRPERWLLERDEQKMAEMNQPHELIFGYGKYQCLGKPIGLMEIGEALRARLTQAKLLRHFDWALAKPESSWKDRNYMGIFGTSDLWLLVTERKAV
ncbi:cytochrome P450 [Lasiosphaeris hirsuta]|uniref:Cytochrome P450 n=1 Tax=Lasiosphaeris hirsuta TaxID=260670 RepID=A0AA40DI33_9PEZI|nr:cytochrome P450 [Lasiosphaeris hirsuta]